MSRRNFKVATTQEGKTTLVKIDKTLTGKTKTIKDREKIRKEREEQYQNFRINALKRRAARMKLSEEDTNKAIENLKKQMNSPNQYQILLLFNPKNKQMLQEALKNEEVVYTNIGPNYAWIDGDQEVLATIREIVPPDTKIHPYVKKKPPILPVEQPKSRDVKTKTKAEKKNAAAAAKKARKALNRNKGHNTNSEAKIRLQKFLKKWHEEKRNLHGKKVKRKAFTGPFAGKTAAEKKKISAKMKAHAEAVKASRIASKKASGTVVQLKTKKGSTAPKKASTLKQAA